MNPEPTKSLEEALQNTLSTHAKNVRIQVVGIDKCDTGK